MKVELKNVTKKFDDITVLDKINLTMESGKIYGLIGRNGSGKSVLLKIISGFYKPTIGGVFVDGINIVTNKSFLPDTRVLIEKPTFLPDCSGFENLKLLAAIQNKIDENDIHKALDDVNLSIEDRKKKYHKYSLGMKQKLGIAQVLMEDPRIMIFDEPFNGIENESVEKIRKILLQEKEKNKIILIASHVKEDIVLLADDVFELNGGKLICHQNIK